MSLLYHIARIQIGISEPIVLETALAACCMSLLEYTQAGLLHELRREVNAMITSVVGKSGSIRKLHVTSLRTKCPLLTSISRGIFGPPDNGKHRPRQAKVVEKGWYD